MNRVSARELQLDFGRHRDGALLDPIVITETGGDELVLMSAAQWDRIRRQPRVGLAEDLPDEWVDAVRDAEVDASGDVSTSI